MSLKIPILAFLFLISIYALERAIKRRSSLSRKGLPFLKTPEGVHPWDFKAILGEGARMHPTTPYILSSAGYEYVVYPPALANEIKRLSAVKASAIDVLTEVYFQGWNIIGEDTSTLHKTIAAEFTRLIPRRISIRQKDAAWACDEALGNCDDWKSFPIYSTAQEIITRLNAATIVGPELGKDTRWLNAVQWFPMALMVAVYVNSSVPRAFQLIVSPLSFMPALALWFYMKVLAKPLARKVLAAYQESYQAPGVGRSKAAIEAEYPFLACLFARYGPCETDVNQVTRDLIVASFESTPATSLALHCMITELIFRPGLIDELRDEVLRFNYDDHLPKNSLQTLTKMDSFMRETARTNPFSYLALLRRTQVPLQFSVGPELPVGTLICIDAHAIADTDKSLQSPGEFDAMRFHNLRQGPNQHSAHQFTAINSGFPGWGDGPQACPGRFFADNTLKIALIHLISNYEFKLPEKTKRSRYRCMPNASMAPDLGARVLIKRRV